MSKNVIKLQLQHMNNIIRVMAEETGARIAHKLGYVLKEEERKVINAFVQGNDVFAVLSMGYGKSFCYGCLPFFFRYDGLSSVVIVYSHTSDCYHERPVSDTLFALLDCFINV